MLSDWLVAELVRARARVSREAARARLAEARCAALEQRLADAQAANESLYRVLSAQAPVVDTSAAGLTRAVAGEKRGMDP